jgi:beta-1,4-mannosyltransferase
MGRIQRLANRVLDRATTTFVVLDDSSASPDAARTTVIPHPHYRDRYVGYPRAAMVRGRVLCVSAGELPSQAADLLAIPRVTDTAGVTIRLAGIAAGALQEFARSAVAQHSATVSTRFERLSDGAQVQEIDAAEIVVLPKVESLTDLQLVFLVLSLDRPVLVPRTAATSRLAEQMGPGWVHVTDGPITAEVVDEVFAAIRGSNRAERPALDGRDLAATHAAYESVFRSAAASRLRR